jgi:hypothetical protein
VSFAGLQGRLQESVFARLGEDADWEGIALPVRILRREEDVEVALGDAGEIVTARTWKVRRSEVAAPEQGQAVQLLDPATGLPDPLGLFRIITDPKLDRKGRWSFDVAPIGAA